MRARRRRFAALVAVALALACRAREPAEARPLRVISLSPATTGILLALDRREALVGVDRFSAELPGAAGLPSLGGLFAPDLERAVELEPTLVLGTRSEQQSAFFAELRRRGVEVHEIDTSGSLADVFANYGAIGVLVGRQAEARALVERVQAQLAAIARSVADRPRRSVALIVEREPLYVVAGGSFASALLETAGGRNAFGDLLQAYPQVSLELLAERAPDVIIDSTRGADGPEAEAAARAHWSRFAWARRVEVIAPGVATLPGAELAQGAALLRARIHPELALAGAP